MLKRLVDTLNLTSWLSTETAKEQLAKAGFRGAGAEYAFVAGRLIAPISFAIIAAVCGSKRSFRQKKRSPARSASNWLAMMA